MGDIHSLTKQKVWEGWGVSPLSPTEVCLEPNTQQQRKSLPFPHQDLFSSRLPVARRPGSKTQARPALGRSRPAQTPHARLARRRLLSGELEFLSEDHCWQPTLGTIHNHGPSPRARRPPGGEQMCEILRIIPTGGGTTTSSSSTSSIAPDHPHGRGDYRGDGGFGAGMDGSSPRAGGLHGLARIARCTGRIIPTGGGTTRRRNRPTGACADHPHGRGDYSARMSRPTTTNGSSPRAGGLLDVRPASIADVRIIPTGGGTTLI